MESENDTVKKNELEFDGKKESEKCDKDRNVPHTSLAAISILTLIGIVCVVIDVYLEKE